MADLVLQFAVISQQNETLTIGVESTSWINLWESECNRPEFVAADAAKIGTSRRMVY